MSGKVVLGRGLEALIPRTERESPDDSTYRTIPLDIIVPNPVQPRRRFDEESLRDLSESFKSQGVLQPVIVKKNGREFVLIAGERRYRAAGMAGLKEIPALVLEEKDELDMLQIALVENLQRENLNPMETAEAYRRLMDEAGLTQNQVALRVGKSRAAVANALRLLLLPEKVKEMIRDGLLTEGHARAILSADGELTRIRLADRIVAENMSVRAAEVSATRVKKRRLIPKKKIPVLVEMENYLKQLLGTSVKIKPGLKKGRIEIEYYGDEDLDRILELFRKIN
jgi:ParB family chromosome partitioning protein